MFALSKKSKKLSQSVQRLFFLWMVFALVLGACSPSPKPTASPQTGPPTGAPATQAPKPTPSPTIDSSDSGLQVIDNGAPLSPQVIEQQPSGGQALAINSPVLLTFDQPMDIEKTSMAWQMVDEDGDEVVGKLSWPAANSMRFSPSKPLHEGALYFASLSADAASVDGVSLGEPLTLQFTTASPLEISQVFPADGAREIENGALITVIFTRPVAPLVIAEEKGDLPDPLEISPAVSGSGEWVNSSVYAFQPEKPLLGQTTYTVTVSAGLSDAAGDSQLEEDFSWHFTTAPPRIKSLSLSGGTINPSERAEDILLDEHFAIDFYQPMDPHSSEAAFSLSGEDEDGLDTIIEWNEDFTQMVITPTQRLALGSAYLLTFDKQAQSANGGKLYEGLRWPFTTVYPPAVSSISPADGSKQRRYERELRVRFVSPMNFESVKERLVLTPKLDEEAQWYYNQWNWSVSIYGLAPSTSYELRILPGMQDIYGNTIKEGLTVRFTTGAYSARAGIQLPYGPALLRDGAPQEFYVTSRNAGSYELKVFELTGEEFIDLLSDQINPYSFEPKSDRLAWGSKEYYPGKLNENTLKQHIPTTQEGQPLPAGFYFIGLDAEGVDYDRVYDDHRLLIIANANLTFKTNTNQSLVWLTDLESGEPLADIDLTIYDESFHVIGGGATGQDGLLSVKMRPPEDPYEDRFAISNDGTVLAFASSQWGSGVSLHDFGIWGSYYAPPDQPKVYLYTDRPLYRPGQPVYFKGIVRMDDDLAYSLPKDRRVSVRISSYKETVFEDEIRLSDYGSFEGQLTLDSDAALGAYSIEIGMGEDEYIGSLGFSVAEYRKPEFQVSVSADPEETLQGESFEVALQADYYSGGGVADAEVNWTLTAYTYRFPAPAEFSRFRFYDIEADRGERGGGGSGSEVIAEGQDLTGADGSLRLSLPADLSESGGSRSLVFEATVTDITQNAVSGRASLVIHNSLAYPGVKSERYVGKTGEEQSFNLVVVDWEGQPLPDQLVDVRIVERRWYSIQEQDPNGNIRWTSSVEEILVESYDDLALDANGVGSAGFVPPNGGIFRAIITTRDTQGNQNSASAYMWVAGENYIPWRQTNDNSFELVTDRDTYEPGDTAEILIASPFQGPAYALVTVERGRIHFQDVVLLNNNSTLYELPISDNMAPNAYVSVLVVKGVDADNPHPAFKMGITEIQVNLTQKELVVELEPDIKQAGPGEAVRYTVRTRDYQGEPVSAEVSLSLSDLATLSLMPSNSDPILDFFYAERSLGIWTSMPLGLSIEDYNAKLSEQLVDEGLASGGGGGKGAGELGVVAVRQDFPDTAFWDAFVITGEDGEANVVVTLPDNLTTWRMDARAVTQDTLVGQSTLDLISSKPLLVRPQTPRFFVSGDLARLGAGVRNNSEKALTVSVGLEGSGLTIEESASQRVRIPAGGQVYVTWDVVINEGAERVDLIFSAEGGGLQDASRPPQGTLDDQGIPVYRYEAPETVATSGQMLEGGTLVEAISLPQEWQINKGELTLAFSPSLAAGMTDGLDFLEHYPYDCVEQTVSKFLPNAISLRALKEAGLSDPELEAALDEQVEIALQRLVNWQNPDGGWGWWSREQSSPLTSAYVLIGLLEAQESGYGISQKVIDNGIKYLRSEVKPVVRLSQPYLLNRQAFLLYVLARSGEADVSSSTQLYEARLNMALYARAYLADTLYKINPDDRRIDTLLSDLSSAATTSASGTHWEEHKHDRYNWNSDTRTTAIVLSTLSQIDPANPINANAVRWLMNHRSNGYWPGTQATAWTLMALTNWMVASGELEADYEYAVAFNGERLGGGVADKENLRQNKTLKVDVTEMLAEGANRLAIAREDGPGNLYYSVHLDISLPVEQIGALDQGIILSRSYYQLDDLETAVSSARQGDLLLARLTLVAPNALHYVVVDDPLPAGLEAVDQSLSTSPQSVEVPQVYTWQDMWWRGWGWWNFSYIQKRDEKVVLSASYLRAGTYVYTYLVRAGTVGEFQTIPPTGQEFYFPEVYGRGEGSLFVVEP